MAQLHDCRIGNQEFEPLRAQCLEATPKNCSHPKRAEELAECRIACRENLEPETQQNVERGFDDEPRQRRTHRRRRTGVRGRQPEMQWEQSRLKSEAGTHQSQRRPNCRGRLHLLSKDRHVQAADAMVDQHNTEQI